MGKSQEPNIHFVYKSPCIKNVDFSTGSIGLTPAFAVSMKTNFKGKPNQIVVFDTIKTNVGGGYSPQTGIFTAPDDGLYMISSTLRSNGRSHVVCRLQLNEKRMAGIYSKNGNTGTVNTVLQLKKGDRVFVQRSHHPEHWILGDHRSMFSGFLIAKTE